MQWIENFQMSRKSFEVLCELIGSSIFKQNTTFRNPVSEEKKLRVHSITSWMTLE